jgi:hypothetical protein
MNRFFFHKIRLPKKNILPPNKIIITQNKLISPKKNIITKKYFVKPRHSFRQGLLTRLANPASCGCGK